MPTASDINIDEKEDAYKLSIAAQFKSKHKAWCAEASNILIDEITVMEDQAAIPGLKAPNRGRQLWKKLYQT